MNDEMEEVDGVWYEYDFDNASVCENTDDTLADFVNIPDEVRDSDGYLHKVRKIGMSAFALCKNLEVVEISDGVEEIEKSAFSGCVNLKVVKLPNSLGKIDDSVFFDCRSLQTVLLPNTIKSIGKDAFNICISLAEIDLPDALESIGDEAFANCESLTRVFIPASVTKIGKDVFYMCKRLKSIQVDPSNAKYYSQDGCVFERETNALIVNPKVDAIHKELRTVISDKGLQSKPNKQKQGFLGKLKSIFK